MNAIELKTEFLRQVRSLADTGDVYPQPCIVLYTNGNLEMQMLALDAVQIQWHVRDILRTDGVAGMAYGLDRTTKEGQGTTRGNVFTWTVYWAGEPLVHGIVEYDRHNVALPDEGNVFWNDHMDGTWANLLAMAGRSSD